jgi:hypothetical protein
MKKGQKNDISFLDSDKERNLSEIKNLISDKKENVDIFSDRKSPLKKEMIVKNKQQQQTTTNTAL